MTDEPYIGMGATVGAGSDCYPATVIDVGSKSVTIQWDTYKREGDEWVYERNPNGKKEVYTLRKNGIQVEGMAPQVTRRLCWSWTQEVLQ